MGEKGPSEPRHAENSTEFTLTEIVGRLWACRGLLVLLPFLGACLALIFILANDGLGRQTTAYHVKLIGIANGQYPNKTGFSPADLKSATVLAALEKRFDVPAGQLEQAISIAYDAPAAAGIAQKYQQRLSARGLQSADIESINNSYMDELSAAMSSGLRIEVNNDVLGLPSDKTIALALAIPATWNEVFVKRYRVLGSSKLTGAGIAAAMKPLSDTTEFLMVGEQLDRIEGGLAIIADDNRLASITTSEGQSAEDIWNLLREFRTIHYNPFLARGFSPDDPVAVSHREQLGLRMASIERQIDGIDRNLARLPGERPANPAAPAFTSSPGMEHGALETVITLVQRASYIDYVQELMNKRQKLVEDMSRAKSRRDSIVIRDTANALRLATDLPETATHDLQTLTSKYRDLYAAAQTRLLETSGTFYMERTTPTVWRPISTSENMKLLAAASVVGLLAAILYAISAPSIRWAIAERQTYTSSEIRMIASKERA